MRRYRFRLEPVRRLRQMEEDQAALALAEARRAAEEAEGLVTASLVRYRQRRSPHGGGVAAFLAAREQAAMSARDLLSAGAEHQVALAAVDAFREAWVTASGKVEALERLDARRRAAHQLDAFRHEEMERDRFVMARWGWKS